MSRKKEKKTKGWILYKKVKIEERKDQYREERKIDDSASGYYPSIVRSDVLRRLAIGGRFEFDEKDCRRKRKER